MAASWAICKMITQSLPLPIIIQKISSFPLNTPVIMASAYSLNIDLTHPQANSRQTLLKDKEKIRNPFLPNNHSVHHSIEHSGNDSQYAFCSPFVYRPCSCNRPIATLPPEVGGDTAVGHLIRRSLFYH